MRCLTGQPMVAGCIKCGWIYKDAPGMGIHRTPIDCPDCGARVRIYPQNVWDEKVRLGDDR